MTTQKRMTVRVVSNVLVSADKGKTWTQIDQFEHVAKFLTHNAALRSAISGHKPEHMRMTDEQTVEIVGPSINGEIGTKSVYSVLKYSGQCPECGASPNHLNAWCPMCQAQMQVSQEQFDGEKALAALLGEKVEESAE